MTHPSSHVTRDFSWKHDAKVFDDIWSSLDGGFTWYQLATANAWSSRSWPSLVFDAQGLLYLVGGESDNTQTGSGTALSDAYVSNQNFNSIGWMTQINSSYVVPKANGGCTGLVCIPTAYNNAGVVTQTDCSAATTCASNAPSGQSSSSHSTLSGDKLLELLLES